MPKRIKNLLIDMDHCLVPYDSDPDHHWIDYVTGTIIQTALDLDISKKTKHISRQPSIGGANRARIIQTIWSKYYRPCPPDGD
jgi:hypothetical protein